MDNIQKNQYVKKQLTKTLLELLQEKSFNEISIKELTETAQVSRVSFYRNYKDKESILCDYTNQKIHTWQMDYMLKNKDKSDTEDMFGSMFAHFKENKEYYILLYKQGLSHILLTTIKELSGPKPEQPNIEAYVAAFVAYGLYGWIEEWFSRGMTESADLMTQLLKQHKSLTTIK